MMNNLDPIDTSSTFTIIGIRLGMSVIGYIAYLVGGFDNVLMALAVLVGLDMISSLVTASFKKDSAHKKDGDSFMGARKTILMLTVIMACNILDILFGISQSDIGLRKVVIYSFIAEEVSVIIRNAYILGLPIPKKIIDVVEILKRNGDLFEAKAKIKDKKDNIETDKNDKDNREVK